MIVNFIVIIIIIVIQVYTTVEVEYKESEVLNYII